MIQHESAYDYTTLGILQEIEIWPYEKIVYA